MIEVNMTDLLNERLLKCLRLLLDSGLSFVALWGQRFIFPWSLLLYRLSLHVIKLEHKHVLLLNLPRARRLRWCVALRIRLIGVASPEL